jgi:sugar/nucleoside kinase (ribokinase family)
VKSTAGAGDALLGATIAALAAGMPLVAARPLRPALAKQTLSTALDFAVLMAALKVTSPHTIHPNADLERLIAFAGKLGVRFSRQILGTFS